VKASLTFSAPVIRQMAHTSIIAPSTANTLASATKTVTGKDRKVRLGFGSFQKIRNLKIMKFLGAFRELRKVTIRFVVSVRLSVYPQRTTLLLLDSFS
jgi:hypothetical protein